MAFGYVESDYRVLEQSVHPARDNPANTRHYELRQGARDAEPPYIAVFTQGPTGEILSDLLLRYVNAEVCRQDWDKLIGPEVIKLMDLAFVERIENHHIGYTRDGGVAMY